MHVYQNTPELIEDPPRSLKEKLRYLGPGFVLSASIVGSGELIATTTLGAKAGFVTLWIILLSCVVKVMLQLEFGKYTIIHQVTAMQAFNQFPGRRFGKVHWMIWTFLGLMIIKLLQLGGIVGGVALAMHIAVPAVEVPVWAFVAAISASLLVYRGKYSLIEKASLIMIGLFTILTFTSLFVLQFTPYAFGISEIASGLSFRLPPEVVGIAIAAFGITGVGGDEIIHYTYWCTEKGYAVKTGPQGNDPGWETRAKGWIKMMQMDAVLAMIDYTVMTGAFYLLGAAVLHKQGNVPAGYDMLDTLSSIYTESLGPNARWAFLLGAGVVLFSTLFAALAAWTRQISDIFGQIGWIDFGDIKQRNKSITWLAWGLPLIWTLLFLFIKLPVLMVLIGGGVTSLILLMVVYAGWRFRYRETPPSFTTTKIYDVLLWISIISILGIVFYSVYQMI